MIIDCMDFLTLSLSLSLSLSLHLSQPAIAPDRSSRRHPVSSKSWFM